MADKFRIIGTPVSVGDGTGHSVDGNISPIIESMITLDSIIKNIEQLPEPPKASVQALNMLEDPKVSIAKVAEFISMEEVLTSKILRLANSAFYGFQGSVHTVGEAMMRVGTNVIKSTLYSSMVEVSKFKITPFFLTLWKSALFTAFAAKEIGGRLKISRSDLCFTGGLLCDLGQIAINEFVAEEYKKLVLESQKSGRFLTEAEYEAFKFTHVQVGLKLADAWKLPIVYQNVIRYHHDPLRAYMKVLKEDYKLIASVHVANNLSPYITDGSGEGIDRKVLQNAGYGYEPEILINSIRPKFELFTNDIERITEAMFGTSTAAR